MIDQHLPNNIELVAVVIPEDFKPEFARLAAEAGVTHEEMVLRLMLQGALCKKQDHLARLAR